MTPTEETQEARHKLCLSRSAFAAMLRVRPAQVRKWETEGEPDPSAAALTAMRLAVELERQRRLPWMTDQLWEAAQIALDDLKAMLGNTVMREERKSFTYAIQVLSALLAQRPE